MSFEQVEVTRARGRIHSVHPRHADEFSGLEVRIGMVGPLAVRFGIHDDRPFVFVTEWVLMAPE